MWGRIILGAVVVLVVVWLAAIWLMLMDPRAWLAVVSISRRFPPPFLFSQYRAKELWQGVGV
jgi:hypothetical protein